MYKAEVKTEAEEADAETNIADDTEPFLKKEAIHPSLKRLRSLANKAARNTTTTWSCMSRLLWSGRGFY